MAEDEDQAGGDEGDCRSGAPSRTVDLVQAGQPDLLGVPDGAFHLVFIDLWGAGLDERARGGAPCPAAWGGQRGGLSSPKQPDGELFPLLASLLPVGIRCRPMPERPLQGRSQLASRRDHGWPVPGEGPTGHEGGGDVGEGLGAVGR